MFLQKRAKFGELRKLQGTPGTHPNITAFICIWQVITRICPISTNSSNYNIPDHLVLNHSC